MKAFIDICPKSHKGGECFILNVKDMSEAFSWFDENMEYLKKQSKRKSVERVALYVMNNYNRIYYNEL